MLRLESGLPGTLRRTGRDRRILRVIGDRANGNSSVCNLQEQKGIEAIIKLRRNSRLDIPSESRRRAVIQYKHLGHKNWANLMGYGRRSLMKQSAQDKESR